MCHRADTKAAMTTRGVSDRAIEASGDVSVNTMIDEIALSLRALQANALSREQRVVSSPQGPVLTVEGRQYVGFCSKKNMCDQTFHIVGQLHCEVRELSHRCTPQFP